MHHGIEYHWWCCLLFANILRQLQNSVWFTTQPAYRSCIVQRIACNCQTVYVPKWHMCLTSCLTLDNETPSNGIHPIDEYPNTQNRDKPVTCMAKVLPQLNEADIESQQHDHDSQYSNNEEQIIQPLLRQLHFHDACKVTKSRAQNKETRFFFLLRRSKFAIYDGKVTKKACKEQRILEN